MLGEGMLVVIFIQDGSNGWRVETWAGRSSPAATVEHSAFLHIYNRYIYKEGVELSRY